MFGIGGFELFLILLFGFLIFGPDKLPEIAKTVGKAIAKFRGAQESMTEQLKDVTLLDKDSENLIKNPLDVLSGVADTTKNAKDKLTSDNANDVSEEEESSDSTETKEVSRSESFAERKARYDRERAKRKQAEAEAAKEAERKAQAEAAAKKEAEENPKIDVGVKLVEEEGE